MWHVTHEHNGEEVCGLHCNYGTEALRYFDDPTNMAIAIYTRTPRGKWRRATRGAASIDGPAQP
jgi:catechol-2,3-dioxygenase